MPDTDEIISSLHLRQRLAEAAVHEARHQLQDEQARRGRERDIFARLTAEAERALNEARQDAARQHQARAEAEMERDRLAAALRRAEAQVTELQRSRWRRWGLRLGLARRASFE